jgi:hypothetical protein
MKERGGFLVGLGQQVDLLGQPERPLPPIGGSFVVKASNAPTT